MPIVKSVFRRSERNFHGDRSHNQLHRGQTYFTVTIVHRMPRKFRGYCKIQANKSIAALQRLFKSIYVTSCERVCAHSRCTSHSIGTERTHLEESRGRLLSTFFEHFFSTRCLSEFLDRSMSSRDGDTNRTFSNSITYLFFLCRATARYSPAI